MKDGESIEAHLKRMKDIVNKLSAIKSTYLKKIKW